MLKFSCEKSLLFNAIAIASRTVSPKSPISVLEGLHIRGGGKLYLTGYNLETGITVSLPAEIQESGDCVLPTKLFFDIVRKLPDEVVTVMVDDTYKVSVQCGISLFHISAEDAVDYPELPDVDGQPSVTLPQRELKEMISGTIFSVSENTTRPIHTGVLFEIEETCIQAVGIDGYRLALRRYHPEEALKPMKFVVPGAALREVEKILEDSDEPAVLTLGKKHITFRMGDATLVCRVLEGEFMDWRKVLQIGEPTRLCANVAELTASIERVSLVVSEKFKSPVRCLFGKNVVEFHTATAMGTAKDQCALAGDCSGLEIGFNCRYLLDALRQVPTEEVTLELTKSLNPIVMTPVDGKDNFTYLILPVRIKTD